MFLLIDKGRWAARLPYNEQFMIFSDFRKCFAKAVERGYGDGSPFAVPGTPPPPGLLTNYSCGDINISFMTMEVDCESKARTRDGKCPVCLFRGCLCDELGSY
jgi:hypothetical protein